jgi:hypothetical protein
MPHPEKAFVWSYALILEIGYSPIWFKTFWLQKADFEKFLHFCQTTASSAPVIKQTRLWLYLITLIIIYSETKLCFEQLYADVILNDWSLSGMLQYYGGIGLYNLHLRENDGLTEKELNSSWILVIFSIGQTILMNFLRQLELLLEIMALIGGIAGYYVSHGFIQGLNEGYDAKRVNR